MLSVRRRYRKGLNNGIAVRPGRFAVFRDFPRVKVVDDAKG